MSEPSMQSPLHDLGLAARAKAMDSSAGAWASELPLAAFISLRGISSDQAFVAAASKALGVALPVKPCTFAIAGEAAPAPLAGGGGEPQTMSSGLPPTPDPSPQGGGGSARRLTALWLSPDEWMIVAPRSDRARLLATLTERLQGIRSQVVDNSGGYTEVLLTGKGATDVMTHVTVYDARSLEAGRVVGTTFGKSSVYLRREADGYVLLFRRSFADYIWRYLERVAGPNGFAVLKSEQAGTS